MGSPESNNWLIEPAIMDEMAVAGGVFAPHDAGAGYYWETPGFGGSASNNSAEMVESFLDTNTLKDFGARKRARPESANEQPKSKACREKLRRDKLNDKFMELGAVLEPGKTPKMDKAAILSDATRMVSQLRNEAQKLKDSNQTLQEKINELKNEKNELRDEKQRLKAEKESLEQQLKAMTVPPSFMPYPPMMPYPFIAPTGQVAGSKLMMPYVGHPGVMFQFQTPANADDKDELPPAA